MLARAWPSLEISDSETSWSRCWTVRFNALLLPHSLQNRRGVQTVRREEIEGDAIDDEIAAS